MNSIGIMQGRLTERDGRSVQFFPFDNWQNEFKTASALGLAEIEYIFDFDRFEENPLWSDAGTAELKEVIASTGVRVDTICADYFMPRPFFRVNAADVAESEGVLKKLISRAVEIGAKRVEIPLLDNSAIKTAEDRKTIVRVLKSAAKLADKDSIAVNIECDLPPHELKSLLEGCGGDRVWVTYDSGNSASLGYDPHEEFLCYGELVTNVHIKDRKLRGGTVPLGTGDADFGVVFSELKKLRYESNFILQAARGHDGQEAVTIAGYKEFVEDCIRRYMR